MVQRDGGSESFERFFAATKDQIYRSLLSVAAVRSSYLPISLERLEMMIRDRLRRDGGSQGPI
jgi:hypothetical protein